MKKRDTMAPQIKTMVSILREFRTASRQSQKAVAARLGVPQEYVSMVETGARVPSIDFLNRCAKLYNMRIHLHLR